VVRIRFAAGSARNGNDIAVIIDIGAGPQYRLDEIALEGVDAAIGDDAREFRKIFGLLAGDIINSDRIIDARGRIDEAMAQGGYAFAETGEPELVIDHAERGGDLAIRVAPGGRYNFGLVRRTFLGQAISR